MEDSLVSAVVELNEEKVIKLVKRELKNKKDPLSIVERVRTGVERVGELYEEGRYFIADLIMSGLIFNEVLKHVNFPEDSTSVFAGIKVVFATVEEDIHDVGKNVTISFFRSRGIHVIDLGVDVPVTKIVEEIEKTKASILCLSGLISSSYKSMKKTVDLLREKQLHKQVKVIIGGNVNEEIKEYVGADYWTPNCARGLEICEKIAREINGN
ncbi:MAG: cobalamin-dependent protein [Clostridiales bacterium]|jgi:methanogenic corrinoid protein MtbC1|nr:cobalamin-dependent protein [Eubacteriales bacterium]MDH7566696.1 cobalamin-dependent protein [Clostridiales bacterium]